MMKIFTMILAALVLFAAVPAFAAENVDGFGNPQGSYFASEAPKGFEDPAPDAAALNEIAPAAGDEAADAEDSAEAQATDNAAEDAAPSKAADTEIIDF